MQMQVKPCTILDLGALTEITDNFHDLSIMTRIHSDLMGYSTVAKWFLMEDCCICYDAIGKRKYQVHIYSVSRDKRGKELRDFAIKAGRWMLDNTEATTFLNFVEPDRRDLKLFMRMIGSKRVGVIPGTEQILYVSDESMGIEENIK